MTEPSKEVRETESDGEFYDACDDLSEEVKDDKKRENEKVFLENFDSDQDDEEEEEDESDLPDFESRPEVKKLKSKLNKLHLSDDVDFKNNDTDTKQDEDEENTEQEKVRITQI
jgi:hypothetical protein